MNTINIKQVMRSLMDMTGCEVNDFGKLELEMRNSYVGCYMPDSNFMEQDETVKELCLLYFRQLLFEFWQRVIVTGDNTYLYNTSTQEGVSFKLLGTGVEVWEELERFIMLGGISRIKTSVRVHEFGKCELDRIALQLMMYAELVVKARAIKDEKEARKFFINGKKNIFKDEK
jgi:hypothetical protein